MVTILAFLFVFSLVVVIHELGHFWAARLFGIRVDRFSLGFGKSLVSVKDRHGTEWTLAAIPLGGYVKFFGDASAASNPDSDRLAQLRESIEAEHGREAVTSCYHFKPVWQRAVVAAAGPFANFVLALAIFISSAALTGDGGLAPVVGAAVAGSPAEAAGFEPGDRVIAINNRPVRYFEDIERHAVLSGGDTNTFRVERNGAPLDLTVTIGRQVGLDAFGGESETGYIGLEPQLPALLRAAEPSSPAAAAGFQAGDVVVSGEGQPVASFNDVRRIVREAGPGPAEFVVLRNDQRVTLNPVLEMREIEGTNVSYLGVGPDASDIVIIERFGPIGAVRRGVELTWEMGAAPVRYIVRTITGKESGRELGGVLRIGKVAGSVADGALRTSDGGPFAGVLSALTQLILLAGALSVSIGLLNLLPIPILDGGHLLYYGYEAVAGRPLGEGAQEWGFRIGLALVLGLMIFATWNDLRYLRVFEAIGNVFS